MWGLLQKAKGEIEVSAIHKFKCDKCSRTVDAKWNREHWLPPVGWAEIHDSASTNLIGHLCEKCVPKKKPKPEKGE